MALRDDLLGLEPGFGEAAGARDYREHLAVDLLLVPRFGVGGFGCDFDELAVLATSGYPARNGARRLGITRAPGGGG